MGDIGQAEQESCSEDYQQEESADGLSAEVSASRAGRHETVGSPTHCQDVRHLIHQ